MWLMKTLLTSGCTNQRGAGQWQERALTDPLTGLPNIRALEVFLQHHPEAKVCCLRLDNLEFLSRHYGILMRVHCKKMITASLQPLLQKDEKLFQLPGSELMLVCWDRARLNVCNLWLTI